jgi:hypothetical protein
MSWWVGEVDPCWRAMPNACACITAKVRYTYLSIGKVALRGAVLGTGGVNTAVLHVDLGAASLPCSKACSANRKIPLIWLTHGHAWHVTETMLQEIGPVARDESREV